MAAYRVLLLSLMMFCLGVWPVFAGSYLDSAHGNSTSGVNRSSIDAKYGSYATGNCGHCHEQHSSLDGVEPQPSGSPANPAMRFAPEEQLCDTCHDGDPVLKDIASELTKPYAHPVLTYSGRHTLSSAEKGQSGAPFRGVLRHSECSDCHEPHTAQAATHVAPGNAVSGVLLGNWGVEPSSDILWQPSLTFSEVTPATMEYQICFKCHSYYALQAVNGISNITGPSGELITDQSMEFSRANRSVHPVRVGLNSQTGSYVPQALAATTMKAPWDIAVGTQTMYCSDCHGTDSTTTVGPHGSNNQFLLGGSWTWPYRPTDGKLWTLADVRNNQNNWDTTMLCAKCHTMISGTTFFNTVHNKSDHYGNGYQSGVYSSYDTRIACIACHTPVPHGSNVSRLIGYDTQPAPYTLTVSTGATFPVVRQFKKAASATAYQKDYCYIVNQAACGTEHNNTVTGAD